MTPQTTFMVVAPVTEGRLEELRAVLAGMTRRPGLADPENGLVPFAHFERLHMARLFILEFPAWRDIEAHDTAPRPYPPSLVFLGDIDGDRESFLAELAETAGDGLRRLFAFCDGFDDRADLAAWMAARHVDEAANYVNMRGRTLRQVREEDALRRALSKRRDELVAEHGHDDPGLLYERLKDFAEEERRAGRLPRTPPEASPPRWVLRNTAHMIGVPLALIVLAPVVLVASPWLIWRLRQLEESDPEVLPRPDAERIVSLSTLEDHDVTNAFSAAGDVKPGLFRRWAATVFLFLLDYAARHIFGRGYLTRVKTIHFARWIFLEDKRRMVFCSNYDGSLESYMDDFINKVAWGLNLVFSNGVGYPATRFLVKGGAEQEEKFKRFLRRHQLYTDVWYKAYPGLTAFDLAENSRVRRGLERRPLGERALRDWLNLL